jgi:DNA mismatch repair protein MutL
MGKVRSLPPDVVLKIAAGEVVERPASVVKELVENAIDAGATEIKIEIQGGGQKLIRVADNGEGMFPEDALRLEQHHQQNIIRRRSSPSDLVPKRHDRGGIEMKIIARREQGLSGIENRVEGGITVQSGETAASKGTLAEVRDLFFNVPVRLKFLKSPGTELGHISDAVARLALANERVRFQLFHEGRLLAHYPLRPEAAARLAEALGREAGEKMHRFSYRNGEVEIAGYAGEPGYDRSNTRGVYLFVNRRPVRDRLLYHAVQEAYRPLLSKERNPVVLLFVNLPPEAVDVNVHPSKGEVKFGPDRVHWQRGSDPPTLRIAWLPNRFPKEFGNHGGIRSFRDSLAGLRRENRDGNCRISWAISMANRQTYLVLTDEGITLIDQHAAHERITLKSPGAVLKI